MLGKKWVSRKRGMEGGEEKGKGKGKGFFTRTYILF
jgi:hypothetical protein